MNRARILLFGKIGQVGWELRRTLAPLGEVIGVEYPDVDFTRPDSVREWVRRVGPDIVVNAAAYTAVDKAESGPDRELAFAINAGAPGIMAEEAKRAGALLVHYSTDYVYDGSKSSPYEETDPVGPLGAYGQSKWEGDAAIQASGASHLIFRLCWVYGARGSNFLLTMRRLARERETIRVVADQVGSPTWSRLIAEATAQALLQVRTREDASEKSGIYHLCSAGHTSWHGFAEAVIGSMAAEERVCREVVPIPSAEYPTPARRPGNSVMSCAKLERVFGLRLPDWRSALELVLEP
jgi:dTDP-4-dehydrorhamnose reductase